MRTGFSYQLWNLLWPPSQNFSNLQFPHLKNYKPKFWFFCIEQVQDSKNFLITHLSSRHRSGSLLRWLSRIPNSSCWGCGVGRCQLSQHHQLIGSSQTLAVHSRADIVIKLVQRQVQRAGKGWNQVQETPGFVAEGLGRPLAFTARTWQTTTCHTSHGVKCESLRQEFTLEEGTSETKSRTSPGADCGISLLRIWIGAVLFSSLTVPWESLPVQSLRDDVECVELGATTSLYPSALPKPESRYHLPGASSAFRSREQEECKVIACYSA